MKQELKKQIIDAALLYNNKHALSINDVSRKAEINAAYLSAMFKYEFAPVMNSKPFEIPERWFIQLANFIGFAVQKEYWQTVETTQFKEVITSLALCKKTMRTCMLICSTGLGKTYSVDRFVNTHPQHTYKITVSSLYQLDDVLDDLAEMLGIEKAYRRTVKLKRIIEKLKEIKLSGGNPMIILDESENLEFAVLRMIKALFDGVKDYAAIVMIGTDQLVEKLTNLTRRGTSARHRNSIPQLYSRFKMNKREISPLKKERDFPLFFSRLHIADNKIMQLAYDSCDSYRDLNNFFEPVLRECDEQNKEVSEDYFRHFHAIPKLKRV
jgi:hypothetical protein